MAVFTSISFSSVLAAGQSVLYPHYGFFSLGLWHTLAQIQEFLTPHRPTAAANRSGRRKGVPLPRPAALSSLRPTTATHARNPRVETALAASLTAMKWG